VVEVFCRKASLRLEQKRFYCTVARSAFLKAQGKRFIRISVKQSFLHIVCLFTAAHASKLASNLGYQVCRSYFQNKRSSLNSSIKPRLRTLNQTRKCARQTFVLPPEMIFWHQSVTALYDMNKNVSGYYHSILWKNLFLINFRAQKFRLVFADGTP